MRAICDRCGFKYDINQLRKEWTGLMVCHGPATNGCWEPRHPQDFVRGVRDDQGVRPNMRPEPQDVFMQTPAFYFSGQPLSGIVCDWEDGALHSASTGFTTARMLEMRNAGVVHPRLFFGGEALFTAGSVAARAALVATWIAEIRFFVDGGFRPIVCWTPSESTGATQYRTTAVQANPSTWANYLTYSGEIAALLAAEFRQDQIALEPYNEPMSDDVVDAASGLAPGARNWGAVLALPLMQAVRAAAPLHRIIIQSGDRAYWGEVMLLPVAMFTGNVSASFHEYRNTCITHPRTLVGCNRLPWPPSDYPVSTEATPYAQALADSTRKVNETSLSAGEKTAAIAENTKELDFVFNLEPQNQAQMLSDWTEVAAWADANGIPRYAIICGEAGMQGHYPGGIGQDLTTRASYMASVKYCNDTLGFGGVIAHKALGDSFSFFEYRNAGGSVVWKDTMIPEMALAMGWTVPARYGTELAGTKDSAVDWTAMFSATLSTEYRSMKIAGSNAYHGADRTMVASGALGKTYRFGVLIERLEGTAPAELAIEVGTGNGGYAAYITSDVGEYFVEGTANQNVAHGSIYANNKPDRIYHVSQQTFKQVL